MISLNDYVGHWSSSEDWTSERQVNAAALLERCADLEAEMVADDVSFPINPKTGTQVSGEVYGGFRPQSCPIGKKDSNHKKGCAVDRYDHDGRIDMWCFAHQPRLRAHGIYIEHPDATLGWSHWASVPPSSGLTVFKP